MTNLFVAARTICDIFLEAIFRVCAPIARTRLYKFCNRPVSVVFAPVIAWLRAKPELAEKDNRRYFVSSKQRMGVFGRGQYTSLPVVVMTGAYSVEVEELMKDRMRKEPIFTMGTREEIMGYVKGLKNSDFNEALTMDYYRIKHLESHIEEIVRSLPNPQTAFRHWLQTKVNSGTITQIDGYVFEQILPTCPPKNCDVGEFLYKYYDSFEIARAVGMHESYRSVETLARYLITQNLKVSFGLMESFEFEEINRKLRDRDISVPSHMGKVTTIFKGNLVQDSEGKSHLIEVTDGTTEVKLEASVANVDATPTTVDATVIALDATITDHNFIYLADLGVLDPALVPVITRNESPFSKNEKSDDQLLKWLTDKGVKQEEIPRIIRLRNRWIAASKSVDTGEDDFVQTKDLTKLSGRSERSKKAK